MTSLLIIASGVMAPISWILSYQIFSWLYYNNPIGLSIQIKVLLRGPVYIILLYLYVQPKDQDKQVLNLENRVARYT